MESNGMSIESENEMKKVVVAIDSFKGSMSSMQAGNACREGIEKAINAKVIVKPLADGGEGTVEALVEGLGGTYQYVEVTGPMGQKVTARYGILPDQSAVMEMAEASGITLVDPDQKDPWKATSAGVGEMILHAVKKGCRKFILGIGGSATTEGGIGMLSALGYEFLDKEGQKLPAEFSSLDKVCSVKEDHVPKELQQCSFQIACDVKNPLCGPQGSVFVFGPQKGVKEEEKKKMDQSLKTYAATLEKSKGDKIHDLPGTGAAGGLGFAFLWGLWNVELRSGIEIVKEAVHLEEELKEADIVVTGEGCLDGQTAMGKAPVGVAKAAKKYGCKVIAFAGCVTEDAKKCNKEGIDAYFSIIPGICTLKEAMDPKTAENNLRNTAEQVFRLLSR